MRVLTFHLSTCTPNPLPAASRPAITAIPPAWSRCAPAPHRSTMRLSVSGPQHPHDSQVPPNPPPPPPPPYRLTDPAMQPPLPDSANYEDWSSDFLQLCNEQLSLIMATVPNIELVALFFRHENEDEGTLEFIPLIVHSADDDDKPARVWISSGSGAAGQTELERAVSSHVLPGSVPANWILPDYPFTSVAHHGGILMPDGGLCVPVEYNDVVAGTIIVRPKVLAQPPDEQWPPRDIRRVALVAKSIALAAALEGKWHAYKGILGSTRTLLDSVRSLLKTTLHQIRSPLQALVTFGHLMLRKLPLKDSNRDLAKHVIVEALRVDDLLKPLDAARQTLILPEGPVPYPPPSATMAHHARQSVHTHVARPGADLNAHADEVLDLEATLDGLMGISSPPPNANPLADDGLQVLWLADILRQQSERARVLCDEKGIAFSIQLDDSADSLTILGVEKFVREAISNLIENALKYSPRGASIGISNRLSPTEATYSDFDDELDLPDDSVWVVVWDTGYGFSSEEIDNVWEYGFRGSSAQKTGVEGSGLGLGITQQLIRSCGGEIELLSPLPYMWDPREADDDTKETCPGSAFILSFQQPLKDDDDGEGDWEPGAKESNEADAVD